MALDCQMPILGRDTLISKEENMNGATILTPEAKGMEDLEQRFYSSETLPAWDLESSPRLYEADLTNPETFHRRLVEWIMNQK